VSEANKFPEVTIEMESGDKIVLELYYELAPNTVLNFIDLCKQSFYDGVTFHRVKRGFMIQGGDPTGTGSGDPGFAIAGEFANNGFATNTLSHDTGVISMARLSSPMDSASTQFFICDAPAKFLDKGYAGFGKVIQGIEFVHEIAKLNTSDNGGQPSTPQIMKTVTVDTFGVDYPAPEHLPSPR
jgi:peptidyl-prolyl cis-trans isomerase B (cyclophilin B)